MRQKLIITTRKSPLALWQAAHVKALLEAAHPELEVQLLKLISQGDKILDAPLNKVGGKGLFVKELEAALLDGRADIAVHSMKDVPMHLPDGLNLMGVLKADDPRDAFVSNKYASLDEMPAEAVLGTSSLRRSAQIKAKYPQLEIKWLRGNIHTRMDKLDSGEYDAIILAASGLERMGLDARIAQKISPEVCLPAVTQGVLGIEGRAGDKDIQHLLAPLFDEHTHTRITAERAMNRRLNGGCQVPIGAYAEHDTKTLWLRGLVGSEDGSQLIESDIKGSVEHAEQLGVELAEKLLLQGAGTLLAQVGIKVE